MKLVNVVEYEVQYILSNFRICPIPNFLFGCMEVSKFP